MAGPRRGQRGHRSIPHGCGLNGRSRTRLRWAQRSGCDDAWTEKGKAHARWRRSPRPNDSAGAEALWEVGTHVTPCVSRRKQPDESRFRDGPDIVNPTSGITSASANRSQVRDECPPDVRRTSRSWDRTRMRTRARRSRRLRAQGKFLPRISDLTLLSTRRRRDRRILAYVVLYLSREGGNRIGTDLASNAGPAEPRNPRIAQPEKHHA